MIINDVSINYNINRQILILLTLGVSRLGRYEGASHILFYSGKWGCKVAGSALFFWLHVLDWYILIFWAYWILSLTKSLSLKLGDVPSNWLLLALMRGIKVHGLWHYGRLLDDPPLGSWISHINPFIFLWGDILLMINNLRGCHRDRLNVFKWC